jgi:transcription elongation factor GreA
MLINFHRMIVHRKGSRNMAEGKKNLLTREGLNKYEAELEDLKVNQRKQIAAEIKEAREQGDLSENAEYDAAKDKQREIEERIVELEALLKNAEVVDEGEEGEINIGYKVKLYDVDADEEVEYYLVGSSEANSLEGKISNESPLGQALIHHRAGETVTVETAEGPLDFRIDEAVKYSNVNDTEEDK